MRAQHDGPRDPLKQGGARTFGFRSGQRALQAGWSTVHSKAHFPVLSSLPTTHPRCLPESNAVHGLIIWSRHITDWVVLCRLPVELCCEIEAVPTWAGSCFLKEAQSTDLFGRAEVQHNVLTAIGEPTFMSFSHCGIISARVAIIDVSNDSTRVPISLTPCASFRTSSVVCAAIYRT